MLALNIALVIVGSAIPIGTAVFWSRAAKIHSSIFENRSDDSIFIHSITGKLLKWVFHHRSKFNVIIAVIVTIIEFLAFIPF